MLTDNGKVFTGGSSSRRWRCCSIEICRENGMEHLLTAAEVADDDGEDRAFPPHAARGVRHWAGVHWLKAAQGALDEWVGTTTTSGGIRRCRMRRPASRFNQTRHGRQTKDGCGGISGAGADHGRVGTRCGARERWWVSRRVGRNGMVCVGWQQVSIGKHHAGQRCDVLVTEQLLQFWVGDELLKTVPAPAREMKKRGRG